MKITLLGTGGPRPDIERQGPGALVQIGNDSLLFDAGRGVVIQLAKLGISPESLNSIFITHHHFDHISNLDDVIMSGWNNGGDVAPVVYGPSGTSAIVEGMLNQVYAKDIKTRLIEDSEGSNTWNDIRNTIKVNDIGRGLVAKSQEWKVYADFVDHMHGLGIPREDWACVGYRIEAEGKTIAISGDAVDCDGLQSLAKNADVLVQCCYLAESEIGDSETERLAEYTLACAPQVGKIASRAAVRKLVLTHFREKSVSLMRSVEATVRKDYSGEIVLGEDLMEVNI